MAIIATIMQNLTSLFIFMSHGLLICPTELVWASWQRRVYTRLARSPHTSLQIETRTIPLSVAPNASGGHGAEPHRGALLSKMSEMRQTAFHALEQCVLERKPRRPRISDTPLLGDWPPWQFAS